MKRRSSRNKMNTWTSWLVSISGSVPLWRLVSAKSKSWKRNIRVSGICWPLLPSLPRKKRTFGTLPFDCLMLRRKIWWISQKDRRTRYRVGKGIKIIDSLRALKSFIWRTSSIKCSSIRQSLWPNRYLRGSWSKACRLCGCSGMNCFSQWAGISPEPSII